jgi:integrase
MTRRGRLKKSSTLYTDKGRISRHIIPLLGSRSVKDVGFAEVNRFLADVIAGKTRVDIKTKLRGRAIVKGGRGTGARTLGLLGGIFTYAVQNGYRSDNPCTGVIKPACQRRKFRLEKDDYARLGRCLAAAEANGEPWQAIGAIRLLALSGCRRGEITDLLRAEVDRGAQLLHLGDTKTGQSTRPIGIATVEVIDELLGRSNSGYVFPSPTKEGKPFRGFPRAFERVVQTELPDLTPHKLRHAFAAVAEDLGFSIPTISALLGHSVGGVTFGYIHKADSALKAAANQVAQGISEMMRGAVESLSPPRPLWVQPTASPNLSKKPPFEEILQPSGGRTIVLS